MKTPHTVTFLGAITAIDEKGANPHDGTTANIYPTIKLQISPNITINTTFTPEAAKQILENITDTYTYLQNQTVLFTTTIYSYPHNGDTLTAENMTIIKTPLETKE